MKEPYFWPEAIAPMSELAGYIRIWNDWVVTPALLFVAIGAYLKYRKASALLLAYSVGLVLIAQFLRLLYPAPLYTASLVFLACEVAGLVVGVVSCVWFWRRDYRAMRTEYDSRIRRGARNTSTETRP